MKTYNGSCHCQTVKFQVKLDLSQGIRKCNCTYCYKTKYQKAFSNFDDLKILGGAGNLVDYRGINSTWPSGTIHHYFCKTCGVQTFSKGYLDIEPFNGWFYAINIVTLDDLTPAEIIRAPVIFEDGLHDKQMDAPTETRHL